MIETTSDLRKEIRRGEAICVNGWWYRVSSKVEGAKQLMRAQAPLSVTMNQDLSKKNVYIHEFTDSLLPLDGEYNGQEIYQGVAYRHGCTTDVKDLWASSLEEARLESKSGASATGLIGMSILSDREALHKRLMVEKLVDKPLASNLPITKDEDDKNGKGTKRRRQIRQSKKGPPQGLGSNAHMEGTKEARAIEEARQKRYREEMMGYKK
jgi:hypothetical protein